MTKARRDGQWIGRVDGDTPGWATLELECSGEWLNGIAYHYPDDPEIVSAAVEFTVPVGRDRYELKDLPTLPFRPHDGRVFPHHEIAQHFPNSTISPTADLEMTFIGPTVHFKFETPPIDGNEPTTGTGHMRRGHVEPSQLQPSVMSWEQFRTFAFTPEPGRYIYRGQSTNDWRLRTSFHRSPRKNLDRYRREVIPDVHRIVSSQSNYQFDMERPDQTGSFYNLLQHHGFPTPLLDWSQSPFIAAYFAFEGVPVDRTEGFVRVFMFNRRAWLDLKQTMTVSFAALHFSVIEVGAIGNSRAVPQQACVTLTNIDDIEDYIAFAAQKRGIEYLRAIDIPVSDRKAALDDLALMGINHGSLFPGLDGTSRSLAYKHFGI